MFGSTTIAFENESGIDTGLEAPMRTRRVAIFDGDGALPLRILELRKKYKWISMIGRIDLSRRMVPFMREETAWMRRLREFEIERRAKLEE